MKFFVSIYIHPMNFNIPHTFLGLTYKHPDELDKLGEIDIQKYPNKIYDPFTSSYFNTIKKCKGKWYENVYPSMLDSNFNGEGFFGFAPVTTDISHWGKVYENNQYVAKANDIINEFTESYYYEERLSSTFRKENRCMFEISKEQYNFLLESIKQDVNFTKDRNPNLKQDDNQLSNPKLNLYYNSNPLNKYPIHNCVTWVLNKLDSIGIETIDDKEWIPDNISKRDSLLKKFYYLQFFNAIFLKFQKIDSNLNSIAGAKAFRKWGRSMIKNKIFCSLKINKDIAQGLNLSTQCKRSITDNIKYYNRIKGKMSKSSDLMIIYNRINEQLDNILSKANNLGFTNIKGDFTFILWDEILNKRMLLDSKHIDKNTKEYKEYPIESIDANIPACNWTLNHNASFILVLKDESICKIICKNYAYKNISQSYIDSINKSYMAILSGKDDLNYWSNSLHTLRKSIKKEALNV